MKALIIVDPQNDFVEGGSLAVEGGYDIVTKITEFLKHHREDYDLVITSQDWHIAPGEHFSSNPDFIDSWPKHCVANSWGSNIVPNLAHYFHIHGNPDAKVIKGEYEAAYSAFDGIIAEETGKEIPYVITDDEGFPDENPRLESLENYLRKNNVNQIDVCGIAEDYCVNQTALDSQKKGFHTRVLSWLTVGINPEKVEEINTAIYPEKGIETITEKDYHENN